MFIMRAFIAIELPAQIKKVLAGVQNELKTSLPKISWVQPDNLHLTVKFLGEITDTQANGVRELMAAALKTTPPFTINLSQLGAFPDLRRPRIIWAGSWETPAQLDQLVQKIQSGCLSLKIPLETRIYKTHVTLARIKNPVRETILAAALKAAQNTFAAQALKINFKGITLFQSVLNAGGPIYSIVDRAEF